MSSASPAGSNPSFSMSAYMVPSTRDSSNSELDDEIASLPSESTAESDLETLSDDYSDAEAEWRESIEQLELLLTMVLVPFVGKYLGRRCAYWGTSLTCSLAGSMLKELQVGQGSWSGNTRSRSLFGIPRCSRAQVWSRQLQAYNDLP